MKKGRNQPQADALNRRARSLRVELRDAGQDVLMFKVSRPAVGAEYRVVKLPVRVPQSPGTEPLQPWRCLDIMPVVAYSTVGRGQPSRCGRYDSWEIHERCCACSPTKSRARLVLRLERVQQGKMPVNAKPLKGIAPGGQG